VRQVRRVRQVRQVWQAWQVRRSERMPAADADSRQRAYGATLSHARPAQVQLQHQIRQLQLRERLRAEHGSTDADDSSVAAAGAAPPFPRWFQPAMLVLPHADPPPPSTGSGVRVLTRHPPHPRTDAEIAERARVEIGLLIVCQVHTPCRDTPDWPRLPTPSAPTPSITALATLTVFGPPPCRSSLRWSG
jgi:hypothetical protein